ncbi:MAG: hypothetical protein IJ796_09485 [Lachnospiraceae bacterium]|nr:hypothetical protein [Lachnospiraceae bacterium]
MKRKAKILFPIIGILLVIIGNMPFFILKGNSVISVREQLDGEIVAYILGAKYLFTGTTVYPEFLGGVPAGALTPPSYGTLLLYKVFSPLYAFLVNQFIVMFTGFLGMYFWGVKLTGRRLFSFFGGLLFSFLPFFTVYGISVSGVPMVMWAFCELVGTGFPGTASDEKIVSAKKNGKAGYISAYICIAYYALFSSLILCGYAVCAVLVCLFVVALTGRKRFGIKTEGIIRSAVATAELPVLYLIMNFDLIIQIFYPEKGFVSHKTEYIKHGASFWTEFSGLFWKGSIAVPSLHSFILVASVIVLMVSAAYMVIGMRAKKTGARESREDDKIGYSDLKSSLIMLAVLLGAAALIAAFSAFMETGAVVSRLNGMDSAIKAFRIDRFYWLYPFIWYSVFILIGKIVDEGIKKYQIGKLLWFVFLIPCALYVLKESPFKENAMEFVRKESTALTWNAFFSEREFADIALYIESETGLEQDEYRVGSLGIEPSVSVYSGFYTIDGYSNNYELEYKKRFRRVIAKELEKNDYNKMYFDEWGNRCYLFSSEYYGNPLLSKYEHAIFRDLELDTEALKELGCKYLFAAGEIVDAGEKGYRLVKIFDDIEYTYVIYLYEVL